MNNIIQGFSAISGYAGHGQDDQALIIKAQQFRARIIDKPFTIGFLTFWEQYSVPGMFNQYGLGGGWRDGFKNIAPMIQEAYQTGKVVIWRQENAWPMGTFVGVATIFGRSEFMGTPSPVGMSELCAPPLIQAMNLAGFVMGPLSKDAVALNAPYGFALSILHNGGPYYRANYRISEDCLSVHVLGAVPGASSHMYIDFRTGTGWKVLSELLYGPPPKDPSPYFYQITVYAFKYVDEPVPADFGSTIQWTLYHTKKINATITPAHESKYDDGTYVYIVATPEGDRTLTEFTVQGVDRLADGTTVFTDLPRIYPNPEDIPDGYKDGQARWYYGPIHSDIYVTAVAEGIEVEEPVKAGIPYTIQMTTDDCLVEAGSWELGATNLPETVTMSISDLGLISLYIPQDVYDGNPGGVYYLNVTFNGYSQTKGLTLLITVEDSPAYGSVWEVLYDFPAPVRGIFQASNGTWYISTTNQIYKSTDLETFDSCTMTGSVDTALCQVVEIAGGKLVVSDKTAIWITDGVTDTFVRQATWTIANGLGVAAKVGGDPSSSTIWHTCQRTGGDTLVWARSSTTGAMTAELRVNMGIHGLSPVPPRLLSNGNWLISMPSTTGYKVYTYDGSSFALVVSGSQNTACLNPFDIDSTGRITLIGVNSLGVFFSRYSDDNGATWSDEVDISAATPASILSLKPGYFLASQATSVGRTADSFANLTTITPALDGNITCFALNEYDKTILAGTLGTTHNLYISRS